MEAEKHALDQKHFRFGITLTSEEDATTRTRKVVNLVLLTDIGDIIQRQVQNNDLNKARECCGNNLRQEHGSRRDFHVVSKLQVRDKAKRLRPVGCEHESWALRSRRVEGRGIETYIVMYPYVLKLV